MATYIPGVTDYIPQIQPFRPDYNFLGNMLQARQSRYDTNYKALNDQYGTLLYSQMFKDKHNKQRDEFFKIINQDIKKMSSMDLSLQKNVDAATRVFDSFYKNKYMVDDMVKVKKYQNESARGEMFKNCLDYDKCNGAWWQDGQDYLDYKVQEYKNSNDEEGLSMEIPSYTPKSNWKERALKYAKDMEYNVSIDTVTSDYIIHDKNGKLIEGGLRMLFNEVYGDDGLVNENYNIQSYLTGKRYVEANAPKVGAEKAEQDWINLALNAGNEKVNKDVTKVNNTYNEVSAKLSKLLTRDKMQGLSPEEIKLVNELQQQKEKLAGVSKNLDVVKSSVTPKEKTPAALKRAAQAAYAQYLLNKDLDEVAYMASLRGMEHKVDVNQYGLARVNHQYALENISAELQAKMTYKEFEYMVDNGMLDKTSGIPDESLKLTGKDYASDDILKDDPYAIYDMNSEDLKNSEVRAENSTSRFLYAAYKTALAASKDPKNPGARIYLEQLYGDKWNKLVDEGSFLSAIQSGTLHDKFKATVDFMNPTNTSKDNDWAEKFIKDNNGNITNINMENAANKLLLKKHVENDKKIVDVMTKQSNEHKYFRDSKLLLTENGIALIGKDMPEEFYKKFMKVHPNADRDDAESIYEALRDSFIDKYNDAADLSLREGFGLAKDLAGNKNITGTPLRSPEIDAARFKSPHLATAKEYTNMVIKEGGKMNGFFFGEPTKENVDNASVTSEDAEKIRNFFNVFYGGLNKNWLREAKKSGGEDKPESDYNSRPQFFMEQSPVAGNNKDLRSVTFYLQPEYYSKLIGSKAKPGAFWDMRDKISQGITMVYNGKELEGPMDRNMLATAYEQIIKLDGYKYEYPGAGSKELTFDKSTGNYWLTQNIIKFNEYTGEEYTQSQSSPLDRNFKPTLDVHNQILATLENIGKANEKTRDYLRKINKTKKQ